MDIDKTLETLRTHHGVSRSFAARLRPLVERAAACLPEKRQRLLAIVDRSFQAEARRRKRARSSGEPAPELTAVADILHDWKPPIWLSIWERRLRSREQD
ncbi:MAG TPA: hypothetical protein ENJ09_16390 [Planctomycetes bacterium]|nr:hypothetical protein [Planctomycetota bacterium]